MKLTEIEKQHIREAIIRAESETAGEVVTVIAKKSDQYWFVSLFWSAVLALCLPALLWFLDAYMPLQYVLASQLILFGVFWFVIDKTPLKFWLLPKRIGYMRSHQKACEQFVECGVHLTKDHTGILLFVSVAEHYVEVLADKGISDVVPQEKWDEIVDGFINEIKQKKIEVGFVNAIHACGDILANYVPPQSNDINELHDGLVEIE